MAPPTVRLRVVGLSAPRSPNRTFSVRFTEPAAFLTVRVTVYSGKAAGKVC